MAARAGAGTRRPRIGKLAVVPWRCWAWCESRRPCRRGPQGTLAPDRRCADRPELERSGGQQIRGRTSRARSPLISPRLTAGDRPKAERIGRPSRGHSAVGVATTREQSRRSSGTGTSLWLWRTRQRRLRPRLRLPASVGGVSRRCRSSVGVARRALADCHPCHQAGWRWGVDFDAAAAQLQRAGRVAASPCRPGRSRRRSRSSAAGSRGSRRSARR